MKRSKKKAMSRAEQRKETIDGANAFAESLRRTNPEQYFAQKSEAANAMMKVHVANDVIQKAYDKGYDAGALMITENLGTTFTAAMCIALHELYGFGRKRLCDLMERMNSEMLDTFTTQEAVQNVYKKLGLRFSKDDPFNWLSFDEEV